jgi:branched-chain amino acid transport system ATP-binding protein
MSNMLLEAKELHTYYGASHILHGIDFNIRKGEGIALMGRNGMGKIHADQEHARPRASRAWPVLVRGDDYSKAPTTGPPAAGIAYVPEGRGIFPI